MPAQWYYNPGAHCGYLQAIQATLTGGKGYRKQWGWHKVAPPASELKSFDQFADAVGAYIGKSLEKNYQWQMQQLQAQIRWGNTPLTSSSGSPASASSSFGSRRSYSKTSSPVWNISRADSMATGRIFDIQRFSIHDGPGIRTTVFFKGCPLRCWWCSNPESLTPRPSLSFLREKCIACGDCVKVCPKGALSLDSDGRALLDRRRCDRCAKCAQECPTQALEIVGRDVEVNEVLAVVLRDHAYYKASGGGVTLSGGEPLLQADFAHELLQAAGKEGLHCCIETSGFAAPDVVERLHPLVDLWLYDYKETDPRLHVKFTRVGNGLILDNLRWLHGKKAKILLRCPMIPEHNARKEHLDGIVTLARQLPGIQGVELLPYFDLWRAKLARFGLTSRLSKSVKPPDREMVKSWEDYLRRHAVPLVGCAGPSTSA